MPKYPLEPNEFSAQLPTERSKTESKQSQISLLHLPNEVLTKILEYLPPSNIAQACGISKQFYEIIMSPYCGPQSSGLNNYLNLFPDDKENTTLTYYDYCEKVKMYKEPFLEKLFSEIKTIQKNLTDCNGWSNVSPRLKEKIFNIGEKKVNNYNEAKEINNLLDEIYMELIKSKINLRSLSQSRHLILDNLNLTRFPKALFADKELERFWKYLISLRINNSQLQTLPAEIGGLQRLETLSLSNNKLTKLPAEIGGLQRLEALSLGDNQLTILPAEIVKLQRLRTLNLNNNQLTKLPVEIVKLQGLRTLNLSNNQLTKLHAEIVELQALRMLDLNNNQLTTLPAEIVELQALITLSLNGNQLRSIPAEIGRLQMLEILSLNDNQLQTLPAEIIELQRLRYFYLNNNQLTTLSAEIAGLQALRGLYLNNNQLTTLFAEIVELQALRVLSLNDNQLTTLPVEIDTLQALIDLYLNNNQLTSESLGQLSSRFGDDFVQETLETQTHPNIFQAEDLSNKNSPRP